MGTGSFLKSVYRNEANPPARCTLVALEMGSLNRHYHALWFLFLYFENCTNFMKKKNPQMCLKKKLLGIKLTKCSLVWYKAVSVSLVKPLFSYQHWLNYDYSQMQPL